MDRGVNARHIGLSLFLIVFNDIGMRMFIMSGLYLQTVHKHNNTLTGTSTQTFRAIRLLEKNIILFQKPVCN